MEIKYGSYVQLDDRFGTVHIWNQEIEKQVKDRKYKATEISKEVYESEMRNPWCRYTEFNTKNHA